MKIDRRSFIALSVGASVGIHISPAPWKLMDDVAIWTQNWPWTPVPERGEVSYVRSVCTLCPGACGIMVRKVNNRAVRIEGMKNHPVSGGGICPLGLSGDAAQAGRQAGRRQMERNRLGRGTKRGHRSTRRSSRQ